MKRYVKIYLDGMGYDDTDYIPCELSGDQAIDIHHIKNRGSGGTKKDERIENLMALTRDNHEKYGDKKKYMSFLYQRHLEFMESRGVKFDRKWITAQIDKYSIYI